MPSFIPDRAAVFQSPSLMRYHHEPPFIDGVNSQNDLRATIDATVVSDLKLKMRKSMKSCLTVRHRRSKLGKARDQRANRKVATKLKRYRVSPPGRILEANGPMVERLLNAA